MKALTPGIGFVAALALALPASAGAAEETSSVLPPENSAANQYTEAVPTAGGNKPSGGNGKKPTPAKVLGSKNAHKLESQGSEGREVARVVAETAPAPSAATQTTAPSGGSPSEPGDSEAKGNGKAGRGGDEGGTSRPQQTEPPVSTPSEASTELPNGSSGFGEVIAEMTGSSSSGRLGALLPLAILAAIAWSLAFFWRQRRPVD